MTLTKTFQETVRKRVKKDSRFKKALFEEAISELISGNRDIAQMLLRYYINGCQN